MNKTEIRKAWRNKGRQLLLLIIFFLGAGGKCMAGNIYSSPYVTFSPDHGAWTTNAWDTAISWYERETTITFGNGVMVPQPGAGQHQYTYLRSGEVPVGLWCVEWEDSVCCHYSYTGSETAWHGIVRGREPCGMPYYSGWFGYCADCGSQINAMYIYMSMEAASSLQTIEAGTGMAYYYLCPWCSNLEQGARIKSHECTGVSNNMYKVVYHANTSGGYTGIMPDSFHMYNNVTTYEGKSTDCRGQLSGNQYERDGFIFTGWNTRPDGSGTAFADKADIRNLSSADYQRNPVEGTVILYAQWKSYEEFILTEKLSVSEGENVFYSSDKGIYYVRSDGKTPFRIDYKAFLNLDPPIKFRIDHGILECSYSGRDGKNGILAKDAKVSDEAYAIDLSQLEFWSEGENILSQGAAVFGKRSENLRKLEAGYQFIISAADSGKMTEIIPRAGVGIGQKVFYSDKERDTGNGILIMADGKPPQIDGLDIFDGLNLIDRDEMTVIADIHAQDGESGLKELYIQVKNIDNGQTGFFTADEKGNVRVDVTKEEPLFTGDFTVTIFASDNVGNSVCYEYGTTEFALQVSVERILSPYDPVFEAGESGVLTITTWGYADKVEVEFAREFTDKDPELNTVFSYEGDRQYRKDEILQFMVPLYVIENEVYEITVRAYKDDKKLEEHPRISVIGVTGTVLDNFRTRLR